MGKDFSKGYKYSLYDKILVLAVTLLEPLEGANRSIEDANGRNRFLDTFIRRFNTAILLKNKGFNIVIHNKRWTGQQL